MEGRAQMKFYCAANDSEESALEDAAAAAANEECAASDADTSTYVSSY